MLGCTSRGDLLTNYNGTAITYDGIGNPLNWRNATSIVWYGRQMSLFTHDNGLLTNYSYNSDGIRTGKQFVDVNGNITGTVKYTLDGNTIVAENRNGTNIYYTYDDKGAIMGMIYGGENYIFSKNLQGDVIGIYNVDGQLVAKYKYNAFGEITAITDANGNDVSSNANHIANINPFRYRGYYYDTETDFYYVSSRYYDPEIGRWINADIPETLIADFENFSQYNLFAYCFNNPVNMSDETGTWPSWVKKAVAVVTVAAVAVAATAITVATCGAGSVAGVAMITATATLAAKATEVAVLQVKKGKSEGKSGSQIAKDTVESIYDNGSKIVGLTPVTKSAGIAFNHGLSSIVEKGFGGTRTLSATLKSTGGKAIPYVFVAIAWTRTIISAFSNSPETRASVRGYVLK